MKKRILSLLCTLALVSGMAVPVSANSGIQVQLNGEYLTFSDAVPEAVSGHTFLPFRTVFEAMGADVDYESDTGTVVAVKDGRTLRMALGSTEAIVTEDGVETVIPMGVAAYAKNNHTYIPVRFAAQAFGCNVGWDGENQTVIIVDLEKLVEDTLAGEAFSLYNQYISHLPSIGPGNQSISGKFNVSSGPIRTDCDISGVESADTGAMEVTLKMVVDTSGMAEQLGQTATDDMKMSGSLQIRGSGNAYYITTSGSLRSVGLPEGAWLSVESADVLSDFTGGMPGLDSLAATGSSLQAWNSMMKFELAPSIANLLAEVSLSDSSTAMETISAELEKLAAPFRDSSFTKTGTGYTAALSLGNEPASLAVTLDLICSGGKVTGYKTTMKNLSVVDEYGTAPIDLTTMDLTTNYTSGGKIEYLSQQKNDDGFEYTANLSLQISASSRAPQTKPPAGATILTIEDLAAESAPFTAAKISNANEAAALVKGTLDAYYTGQCDSNFLSLTGLTTQEVKFLYEYNVDAEYDYLCYQFQIMDEYLTAANRAKLKSILTSAYSQAGYSVTATALSDGEYSVRVDLTPCALFKQVNDRDMEGYTDRFTSSYGITEEMAYAMTDAEQEAFYTKYENEWAAGIIKLCQDRLSAGGFQGKPVSKLVLLSPSGTRGLYFISDEDFSTIDTVMLSY
jgi:hypothetical protein